MDRTADPCSNFFRYACGTWIDQHPPGAGYVEARFYDGDNRSDAFYELLLDDRLAVSDPDVAAAQRYYSTCVASRDGTDPSDFGPASALLAAVDAVATPSDLATAVVTLHQSGVAALFSASVRADYGDPTRNVVWIGPSGWGLPSRNDYSVGGTTEALYERHVASLAAMYPGVTLDPAPIVAFELALLTGAPSGDAERDPVAIYNPTDPGGLATLVPDFDWSSYFTGMGYGPTPPLVSLSPDYFRALESLLSTTPLDVQKQYLKWRILERTAYAAGHETATEDTQFHEGVVDGRSDLSPDWWVCFRSTRAVFGFPLARQFVTRLVTPDPRPAVTRLAETIRAALRTDFRRISWLDAPTAARAIDKLDAIRLDVGYPDVWPPTDDASVTSSGTFAQMIDALTRSGRNDGAATLTKPVDRKAWVLSPDTTNAVYSPARNGVTLPVAILQDPFYSSSWSSPGIYGALGAVIGHEMTHGFDDSGRHFDGGGKLSDWWSPSVADEFTKRASCVVDQYDAYEPIPGRYIDGTLTLGENIADLGGLSLSYEALEAAGAGGGAGEFSAEQEFFLTYAQLHCANESPESLDLSLSTDPHSPDEYRVNGVVQNVAAFAAAFHCAAGAPLAPKSRCQVW